MWMIITLFVIKYAVILLYLGSAAQYDVRMRSVNLTVPVLRNCDANKCIHLKERVVSKLGWILVSPELLSVDILVFDINVSFLMNHVNFQHYCTDYTSRRSDESGVSRHNLKIFVSFVLISCKTPPDFRLSKIILCTISCDLRERISCIILT